MTETSKARYAFVLGVDPGTTTGLALARFDLQDFGRPSAAWWGQYSWQQACSTIETKIFQMKAKVKEGMIDQAAVAPEQFTLNAQSAQRGQQGADDALGVLGVVQYCCGRYELDLGPRETASAAKNLISDTVLKYFDLYHKGQKHSNDAFRHALLLGVKRDWLTAGMLGRAALS